MSDDLRPDSQGEPRCSSSWPIRTSKRQEAKLVSATKRRERGSTDWAAVDIEKPAFLGVRVLDDVPLEKFAATSTGRRSSWPGS
jgi:cobalamin-dependent methionine synthase I